jgi:hypothetical protein
VFAGEFKAKDESNWIEKNNSNSTVKATSSSQLISLLNYVK